MTPEQIKQSSQKKVDAVTTLCKQLQIVITAEQMITDRGFIKQVVYYNDNEKYDIDKPPVTPKPDENTKPPEVPQTPAPPKPPEVPQPPKVPETLIPPKVTPKV